MDWDVFWGVMFAMMIWIPLLMAWVFSIMHLFSRPDMSGVKKAIWFLLILFLPIIGTVCYFIFTPSVLTGERPPGQAQNWNELPSRVSVLSDLRSQGVISQEQFDQGLTVVTDPSRQQWA